MLYKMPRFHCEFQTCNCQKFNSRNKMCLCCNHANIWHSSTNREESRSQFESSREKARKPTYRSDMYFVECFVPEPSVPPLPDTSLCCEYIALPV